MADEPDDDDANDPGTPPEGAAPVEDEPGTPPGPEADAAADGSTHEPPEHPERDPAWQNLEKKFAHIEDPVERQDAIAKAYWEKTNWASKVNQENKALKRQLAQIESERKAQPAKEEPATPPPPAPEIQELDQRLTSLYNDDQGLIKEANAQLVSLNEVDAEIAKCQARIEDAKEASDETKQTRNEARLAALEAKKDGIVRSYRLTQRERTTIAREYEKVAHDRAWLERSLKDRDSRQAQQAQEEADFRQDFPTEVSNTIEATATKLGIPESYLEELNEEVTDGLLVDLWKLGEVSLDDADVPGLVKARVEKFMQTRNIAARHKFATTSREKLRVASAPARPPAPGQKPPAPKGKPVTPESMNQGDRTSKMQAARDYLVSKGY